MIINLKILKDFMMKENHKQYQNNIKRTGKIFATYITNFKGLMSHICLICIYDSQKLRSTKGKINEQ